VPGAAAQTCDVIADDPIFGLIAYGLMIAKISSTLEVVRNQTSSGSGDHEQGPNRAARFCVVS